MSDGLTVELTVHFKQGTRGVKALVEGEAKPAKAAPDRLPRVAHLMALAIKMDGLLRHGVAKDYADLARLGRVSRPRMTQIMCLLNLAPDIQESVLFLQPVRAGYDPVTERDIRKIAAEMEWRKQRVMWKLQGK